MRPEALLGLLLAAGPAFGQDAAPTLTMAVDFGSYRAARGQTSLEIYLEVPREGLTYHPQGRVWRVDLAVAHLLKFEGQIIEFSDVSLADRRTAADTARGSITSTTTLTVPPGNYALQVVIDDGHGATLDKTFPVKVPAYAGDRLDMSAIQLARQINWAGPVAATSRLGLQIVPAVERSFPAGAAWLWYLAEVYGLSPEDTVALAVAVVRDSAVVAGDAWHVPVPANTVAERGALLLSGLEPGEYVLSLEAAAAGDTLRRTVSFNILAADSAVVTDTLTAWEKLPRRQKRALAEAFGALWPKFNSRRFRSFSAEEQHARISAAADTLAMISLDELLARWELVRSLDRGRPRRQGLSAQARLLLRQGPPQVIRVAPATYSQHEVQLWRYGADGPLYFLADRSGRGDFVELQGTDVPLYLLQSATARATLQKAADPATADSLSADPAPADSLSADPAPADSLSAEPPGAP